MPRTIVTQTDVDRWKEEDTRQAKSAVDAVVRWLDEAVSGGEPAGNYAPHVRVWSEMAVRATVIRALERYERERYPKE